VVGAEKLKPESEPTRELLKKFQRARAQMRGLRKPASEDVFRRLALLHPDQLHVVNYGRKRPLAAFNPGALLNGNRLLIYPRLIFEYYWYASSIGLLELKPESLLRQEELGEVPVKVILYPSGPEDLRGCEDPRVQRIGGRNLMLYTSVSPSESGVEPRQSVAEVADEGMRRLGHLKMRYGDKYYVTFWKDSALIGEYLQGAWLLTRPSIPLPGGGFLEVGWSGPLDAEEWAVGVESMEPSLVSEDFEVKVGWSTNAVRLSSNEYLVGWHGVGVDYIYRNGLALVDGEGNLLGVSDYLLSPKPSIDEFYGDRPGVVFGCGLVGLQEYLLWVGGVADYAIGVWIAETEKVLEHVKYLRG